MTSSKPIIGITLDWQEEGSFSSRPHYCLRHHYFDAIIKAGGIPMFIGYDRHLADDYTKLIDGLLIPGGDFAFPQSWYTDSSEQSPFEPSPRLAMDIALMEHALVKRMPIFAICAGMQVLACMHQCTLTSHIKSNVQHKGPSRARTAHDIHINDHTMLHSIINEEQYAVNSAHEEVVNQTSDQVVVSARASDGAIEAIELPNYPFAIGVQWHPEFFLDDTSHDMKLFRTFVDASLTYRSSSL